MGFSRQEYRSGLPLPSPGDVPDPGMEPRPPTLQADSLPFEPPGKPLLRNSTSKTQGWVWWIGRLGLTYIHCWYCAYIHYCKIDNWWEPLKKVIKDIKIKKKKLKNSRFSSVSQTAKPDLCSVATPFMRRTQVECAHMTWSVFFRSEWKGHSPYTCRVECDAEKNNVSLQSCPTLCDPMDCSLPDSSVHGILQARILERGAMPSSRGSSPPRDGTLVSCVSCIGRRVLYHCTT